MFSRSLLHRVGTVVVISLLAAGNVAGSARAAGYGQVAPVWTVGGTVTNAASHLPIHGVTITTRVCVSIGCYPGPAATTNWQGAYQLTFALRCATFIDLNITATVWRYASQTQRTTVCGRNLTLNFALAASYNYECAGNPSLTIVPNVTVENLPDARLVGQCSFFATSDPYYFRLYRASINVFTAPNEFPGVYVLHNGLQGPQPVYGTWIFK